jgi:DNA-binding NarL/FixJ family response regulator
MKTHSVFVCETQPIVIEGLQRVLSSHPDFSFAGSVTISSELLQKLSDVKPDLLLIDQSIGLRNAMQLAADSRAVSPSSASILWTNDLSESECLRCLQSGFRGIVRKTQPVSLLVECLRAVAQGGLWLEHPIEKVQQSLGARRNLPRFTTREKEIVQHVCRGLKNRQIAEALAITPGTVKVHLMHIFEKAGVRDRFELAVQGGKLLGEAENGAAAQDVAVGQP